MYSAKVRWLVANLPGRGRLEACTHVGEASNPVCGDSIRLELCCEGGQVVAAVFQAEGCAAAIASAAAVAQLIGGRSVPDSLGLSLEDLLRYLDGLPPHKQHGAEMAIQALQQALGKV